MCRKLLMITQLNLHFLLVDACSCQCWKYSLIVLLNYKEQDKIICRGLCTQGYSFRWSRHSTTLQLASTVEPKKKFPVLAKFCSMCMYVFAITATLFNLELSNFGITFLMWISKNGFLKFKKNYFCAELLPFFYISLRFLCSKRSPMLIIARRILKITFLM